MNKISSLLPSSIGLIFLAIIYSFATLNLSNIWIPISGIFLVLALLVFVIRATFLSIEKRLKILEEQVKK